MYFLVNKNIGVSVILLILRRDDAKEFPDVNVR